MSESNFRKVFDLRKLTQDELGCVEYVLNSPAYVEVFEPYLRATRDSMQALWLDRSQRRKEDYPDDFLAGGVAAIDGLMTFFATILIETNMDRIHDAMTRKSPDDVYTEKQERGMVQPVIGVDQQSEPEYNAAEDF